MAGGAGHGTLFFKRYALSHQEGEVKFPAFIGAFNESYQSNWERQTVFGRSDPMQFYGGTQRVLNVTFTLVASSAEIARLQLTSLDQLIKYLYPNYANNAYSAPPIIGVKYENLIRDGADFLVGTMGNFNFTPNFDDGVYTPRDLTQEGLVNDWMEIYPQTIELSFDFYPIHRDTLGWSGDRFMGNDFHPIHMTQETLDKQAEGLRQLQAIYKDMYGETVESADALQALMDFSDITQEELAKKKKQSLPGTPQSVVGASTAESLIQAQDALDAALEKAKKSGDKTLISFFEKKQAELKQKALKL